MGIVFKMYAEDWNGRFPQSQIDDRDLNNIDVRLFCVNGRAIFPEYLSDASVLVCPSDSMGVESFKAGRWNLDGDPSKPIVPEAFDAVSYVYFPWAANNDIELQAMYEYARRIIESTPAGSPNVDVVDEDMNLFGTQWEEMGNAGGATIYRLRLGIERFFITDINMPAASASPKSKVPVMMDWLAIPPFFADYSTISSVMHSFPGANVLFLDGHVEFLRYPGDFPVSTDSAKWIGMMYMMECNLSR